MNLAFKYPIIFWNCACLISDAGGNEQEELEEKEEIIVEEVYNCNIEEFSADAEDEDDDNEEETSTKAKKKTKVTNYGKIASAIGKIQSTGVKIAPPDINKSTFTFSPDVGQQVIRFGLSGISRVGEDLVKTIMGGRPYSSISDFLAKNKVNKVQMINLIKSGAFDSFGNRISIMSNYIEQISDTKKRITLQNMKMLIEFGLIPDEYDLQIRVYNFNKYVKKFKDGVFYEFDNIAFNFYSSRFDIDLCTPSDNSESGFKIKQTIWDNIYKKQMDIVRPYIVKHNKELLNKLNEQLIKEVWDKYCLGNISKWEMDSISCYIHSHELEGIDFDRYGFSDFNSLSENPIIDRYIPIKGKMVPIFVLNRIAGTVLDRDKAKKIVTLLTRDGVVTVKIYGGVFTQYDKQISERGADGKKHIIEKSVFSRGNKIIVTGIRQGDSFLAKTYSRTPYHKVEQITEIKNNELVIKKERADLEGE